MNKALKHSYIGNNNKNVPFICQRYAKDMPKYLLKIGQRYDKDIPKICQRYAKYMQKICQRYAKDMP